MINVAMFLYFQGFQSLDMGYVSAVEWVLSLIVLIVTVFNWRIKRRWVYEGDSIWRDVGTGQSRSGG